MKWDWRYTTIATHSSSSREPNAGISKIPSTVAGTSKNQLDDSQFECILVNRAHIYYSESLIRTAYFPISNIINIHCPLWFTGMCMFHNDNLLIYSWYWEIGRYNKNNINLIIVSISFIKIYFIANVVQNLVRVGK